MIYFWQIENLGKIISILLHFLNSYFLLNFRETFQLQVVPGRVIDIKRGSSNGVAFFEFEDLCDKPLGSSDYIAIARNFHSVLIRDIPQLSFENRNVTKRFILLVIINKTKKKFHLKKEVIILY